MKKGVANQDVVNYDNLYSIGYSVSHQQGECILRSIQGIRKVRWKFILFIIYTILLIGFPALFCFWYIELERWLYYDYCSFNDATHFYVLNYDQVYTIVKKETGPIMHNDISKEQTVYFINRFMKYYYDGAKGTFQAIAFNFIPRIATVINERIGINGFEYETVAQLRECYGQCAMELPRPSCPELFMREVLQPFYLFIIYSVILWYYQRYIYYASIIAATSIASIGINLYQVMQLNKKIYEMAFYTTPMQVLRNKDVLEVSSIDLVPGDIVFIKKSIKLPFDGVLLGGSVLMNESALTGQSVPIVKKAIDKQQFTQSQIIDKSSLLYEGTELVQLCSHSSNPVHTAFNEYGLMVMVTRSNFSTMKGQLIRIITFPRSRSIKFYTESAKFIAFLFCLAIISYAILIAKLRAYVDTDDLVTKFFDLITITVPPGLPASMSVGIVYSLNKLKNKNIYCISPDKIILGGRVEHICFDKTGTLTEEFMDFYEFVPKMGKDFQNPIRLTNKNTPENQRNLSTPDSINALDNMASCHSIMNLEGDNRLMGDPMEIKLFQFGGYQLTSDSPVRSNFKESLFSYQGPATSGTVFRRFEFNSDIHRMSVIASSSAAPTTASVYCKGAPESMLKIMKSGGIPVNYKDTLEKYTSCGFRVLAVASKQISLNDIDTISRETAEIDLDFNGFEVFENKLKPETVPAMRVLREAGISIVIITGDNPLTGANIGFKAGVIDKHLNVMIIDTAPNNKLIVKNFFEQNKSDLETTDASEGYIHELQPKIKSEQDFECTVEELPSLAIQIGKKGSCVFCITGTAFASVFDTQLTDEKREFIKYIKVFARAKPNDKTRAIVVYQTMGKITAMCGDGANDCGALKQADAGLSLSEAEASISSPFTSKTPNISSMIDLIRECRGGLATNFSLFNIMALYSLIQYSSTVITEYYYGYPADLEYLYWDLGCNFFFFLTIGYTASSENLSKLRPSDSLFSVSNIICVLVMFIIQLVGQISVIIVMANQPFYDILNYGTMAGEINDLNAYFANGNTFSQTTLQVQAIFMFSNFMYVFSVMAFSISKPWKKTFLTNIPFMVVLVIIFAYNVIICLVPEARIPGFFLTPLDMRFQGLICGMGCAFGIFMFVLQKLILENIFNYLREKYPEKGWL